MDLNDVKRLMAKRAKELSKKYPGLEIISLKHQELHEDSRMYKVGVLLSYCSRTPFLGIKVNLDNDTDDYIKGLIDEAFKALEKALYKLKEKEVPFIV